MKQATAIYDGERIDCDATQAAGKCPWQDAMVGHGTPVLGMLGTDCWYRGKAGTWMLDELQRAGHELPASIDQGFYGHDESDPNLPPEYCIELAKWMEDRAEVYASLQTGPVDEARAAVDRFRYAAWWMRWVGENADGATAWW